MKLRYAEAGDKDGLRKLWSLCFPGEQAFTDYFFSEIYRPENALLIEDGEIAAMLHMLPRSFVFGDRELSVSYVYGVGTHPDFRRRGLSASLMDQAFFEMHLRSVALSVLIPQEPWLFDFYRQFGYAEVFRLRKEKTAPAQRERVPIRSAEHKDLDSLNRLYEQAMARRCFVKRSPTHWRQIIREAGLSGGEVYVAEIDNKPAAYAVYSGDTVIESAGQDENLRRGLVSEVIRKAGLAERAQLLPADPAGERFGCARIIEARACMEALMPEGLDCFISEDRLCPWNNGAGKQDQAGQEPVGPEQMANKLFSPQRGRAPYMNLMHN